MTSIAQINNSFDLAYDQANSFSSPGLDMFEKSMFLTTAYHEIVSELADQYETSEKMRRQLAGLVKNYNVNIDANFQNSTDSIKISSKSYRFEKPPHTMLRIWTERIYTSETDSIEVIPKTHDEYNRQILNPFKKPNLNKAWRLDVSNVDGDFMEIICDVTPVAYQIRYLKKPDPIILTDLSEEDAIEGKTDMSTGIEVGQELIPTIINRAVLLATVAYKENSAQAQIAINNK